MKKLILSASLIATFMLYVVYERAGVAPEYVAPSSNAPLSRNQTVSTGAVVAPPPAPVSIPAPTPTPTPTPVVTKPALPPTPVVKPKPKGMYRDGEYTGNVVDVYYGNVQVKAIIQNGKLADVRFLQYPSDRQTSRYINAQAMPALTSEAIQTQNANVDTISGATATSGGFVDSLGSALLQAKN